MNTHISFILRKAIKDMKSDFKDGRNEDKLAFQELKVLTY